MEIIAVPYTDGDIFQHFGKTPAFLIAETDGKKILDSKIVSTDGAGHSALKDFLKDRFVNTVIVGGMGDGALNALKEVSIKAIRGQSGSAEAAIMFYLNGDLKDNPETGSCHHHEGGHTCGSNGCSH